MDEIRSCFIRKRGANYNIVVEYYNQDGKIKQKSVAKCSSKKEANQKLIEVKNNINKNNYTVGKDITVVDRFQAYIDENKDRWSPCTVRNYEISKRLTVEPFFKKTLLKDLTAYQVQQYINYLHKNYSYSGMKMRYAFLNTVLREAYRFREIQDNLCELVKLPKSVSKSETNIYSREEVKRLLDTLESPIQLPIVLMLLLGLRIGEATALRWADVSFEKKTISINQIIVYVNSKVIFKKPKTSGSIRTMYVQDYVMKLLKEEYARQKQLNRYDVFNDKDLVCRNRYGDVWLPQVLSNNYKKFCEIHGFRVLRIHDLRHTAATLMVLAGVDFKTISTRLGHSSVKITLDRYSHVLDEMDKTAVRKFEDMLDI